MADSRPRIHGIAPFVPASKLVEATGEALTQIRREDGLTWGDIGEAIGKSEDQAAKYASGVAVMDFITWLRACTRWNGRFSVAATMVGLSVTSLGPTSSAHDVRQGMLSLMLLMAEIQKAMLDETLEDDELLAMDALIEQASQFLVSMRKRVAAAKAANAERRDTP